MDQADTLRRLMQARDSQGDGAERDLNMVSLLVSGARSGAGATSVSMMLARYFHACSINVLTVSGRDQHLHQKVDQDTCSVSGGIWKYQAREGLHAISGCSAELRTRILWMMQRTESELGLIVADLSSDVHSRQGDLSLAMPNERRVVVIGGEDRGKSICEELRFFRKMREHLGKTRFGIIVNRVTDGQEAQQAFRSLNEEIVKNMDIQLDYLGHLPYDENFFQAAMNDDFLIDLKSRALPVLCIELVAKRLEQLGIVSFQGRKAQRRFTEEPALLRGEF